MRRESSDDTIVLCYLTREPARLQHERHPCLEGARRILKTGRHDADDRIPPTIKSNPLSDDTSMADEAATRQLHGMQLDTSAPGLILVMSERPAHACEHA